MGKIKFTTEEMAAANRQELQDIGFKGTPISFLQIIFTRQIKHMLRTDISGLYEGSLVFPFETAVYPTANAIVEPSRLGMLMATLRKPNDAKSLIVHAVYRQGREEQLVSCGQYNMDFKVQQSLSPLYSSYPGSYLMIRQAELGSFTDGAIEENYKPSRISGSQLHKSCRFHKTRKLCPAVKI